MANVMLSILALSVSLSIDALGAGISYGLRKVRIPAVSKLIICLFSIAYSASALLLGSTLGSAMPKLAARIIGIAVLALMGTWIIVRSLLEGKYTEEEKVEKPIKNGTIFQLAIKSLGITVQVIRNPEKSDIDKSGIIDIRESLLLGLALSVDAIGAGIGSALAGFTSIYIPIAVGLFQWFFLYTGTHIGMSLSSVMNNHKRILAVIPGLLMIFLAALRI